MNVCHASESVFSSRPGDGRSFLTPGHPSIPLETEALHSTFRKDKDAAFLLTVGSFLLTVEFFYLQLTILAFLPTIGAFLLTVLASLLTVGAFCLQCESASNKGLKGL